MDPSDFFRWVDNNIGFHARRYKYARQSYTKYNNDEERIIAWVKDKLQLYRFRSVQSMSLSELKQMCQFLRINTEHFLEKSEFISAAKIRRGNGCCICTEEFHDNEELRVTLCGHSFHETCLIEWLKTDPKRLKCAYCNQNPFESPQTRKRQRDSE